MFRNPVLNITFISTNVRKKRKKGKKRTAGCMQDKNVKLPFMYQPPVPDITKFDKFRFYSKKFLISFGKKLGKHVLLKREKQDK